MSTQQARTAAVESARNHNNAVAIEHELPNEGSVVVVTKGEEQREGVVVRWNTKSARVRFEDGTEETVKNGDWAPATGADGATMSKTLNKYRANYVATIASSGRKSLSNGDELAKFLEYKGPGDVIAIAERALDLGDGFLKAKYAKLNPGQQRMNAGNRLRAAIKRGDLTVDQIKSA